MTFNFKSFFSDTVLWYALGLFVGGLACLLNPGWIKVILIGATVIGFCGIVWKIAQHSQTLL